MSKELTDAKRKAIKKYDSANTVQVHLKLNKNTDADIIEWIGQQDNVQGRIKQMIRKAMREDPGNRLHIQLIGRLNGTGEK